jgi:uncharacterized protein (DUF952 family)
VTDPRPRTILHITTTAAFEQAQATGHVTADSLDTEGFIHCSTVDQVQATANRIFRGSGDLLLLEVDTTKLQAPLEYERATDANDEFPHIYGVLNLDAIIRTLPLPEGPDGYAFP